MGSVGVSSGPGQQGPGVNSINQGLNWRELVELVSVYVPVYTTTTGITLYTSATHYLYLFIPEAKTQYSSYILLCVDCGVMR